MVWVEGDFFTCRDCGAQLEVKRQGRPVANEAHFYPTCPWCGRIMNIVNVVGPVEPPGYMGEMEPAEEGDA